MKRLFSWIGMAILGIGTAFVILEIALRATGYSEPIFYQADQKLGWALRPGARGTYMDEGRALVRISAAGMRDRLHGKEKPKDAYRIALIGDGYVEAMQVEDRDTVGFLLESRLAQCKFRPGKRIEVMNFGVRGYRLPQMLEVLESRARAYAPDLVLVALSSDAATPERRVRVVKLDPPWQELLWTGADRLRSVQLLHGQYHRMADAGLLHADVPEVPAGSADAYLPRLKKAAAEAGATLMVALVHPQPQVEAISKKHGIPVIALADEMRRLEQAEGVPFHGFANAVLGRGHWNRRGHLAAADILAAQLCGGAGSGNGAGSAQKVGAPAAR
jgi:hypothetical protein